MSNNTPNLELHKMRLELKLSEMRLSLQRQDVRLLELEEEKAKINENKDATLKEIENLKSQISQGGK